MYAEKKHLITISKKIGGEVRIHFLWLLEKKN